jgi:hypothetical protein
MMRCSWKGKEGGAAEWSGLGLQGWVSGIQGEAAGKGGAGLLGMYCIVKKIK